MIFTTDCEIFPAFILPPLILIFPFAPSITLPAALLITAVITLLFVMVPSFFNSSLTFRAALLVK